MQARGPGGASAPGAGDGATHHDRPTPPARPRASTSEAPSRRGLALLALFIGVLGFALTPILVRLSEVGPIATAFWRAALAFPVLWTVMSIEVRGGAGSTRRPRAPRPRSARDYGWLVFASMAMAGDLILFQTAVHYTTIANAALLGGLQPIFVVFGAWFLFRERITALFLLGMAVALTGASLLVLAGPVHEAGLRAGIALGDILALGAALTFALYSLGLRELRGRFSTATVMTWNMGLGAVVLLPAAWLAGQSVVPQSVYGWAVVIGFALVVDLMGRSSYTFAFAHLPASFNSVGMLSMPVVAAALAWLLFDEAISTGQGLAAAVVLAGIFLAQRAQARGRENPRTKG